jgi:hypothetical protein
MPATSWMRKKTKPTDAPAREMTELSERERIRRWLRGQHVAEEVQHRLRAEEGPNPARAVAHCLSALAALEAMGRWPAPPDAVAEQQIAVVRARWLRIQRHARAAMERAGVGAALEKGVVEAVARFEADLRRLARDGAQLRRHAGAPLRSGAPSRRRAGPRRGRNR